MTETWAEMTKRHKAERRALVEYWAKRRVTQTFAAKKLGMKLSNLHGFVKRNKIHWPVKAQGSGPKGHKGRPEIYLDIDAIEEYYLDGFSMKDCAEKFGVHKNTIAKRLKAAGVKIRPNIVTQKMELRATLAQHT